MPWRRWLTKAYLVQTELLLRRGAVKQRATKPRLSLYIKISTP
jgi:hypothetical protein